MMRSCLVTEVLKQRCYEGSCIWFHLNVCMKDLNLWEGRDHSNPSHDSFEFQKIFIIPFETDQTNNLTSCFSTGIFSKKIPELFFGNKIWYVCVSLKKNRRKNPPFSRQEHYPTSLNHSGNFTNSANATDATDAASGWECQGSRMVNMANLQMFHLGFQS